MIEQLELLLNENLSLGRELELPSTEKVVEFCKKCASYEDGSKHRRRERRANPLKNFIMLEYVALNDPMVLLALGGDLVGD
jgi:hypothetical protein